MPLRLRKYRFLNFPKYYQELIMDYRNLFKVIGFCVALLGASMAWGDIRMGVFPRGAVADTYAAFKPLAQKISQELGEPVELVVPKDFKEFWAQLEQNGFDIVHFNQYHYIKGHKELGYKVFAANEEHGEKQVRGTIVVRADSGINTLADLKGKTILFGGDEKAMVSYIVPVAMLKRAGLELGKDYHVQFAKNIPSTAIAVFNKASDAAAAGDAMLKSKAVHEKIDISQLKVLALSEPFTHLCWAVKGDFSIDKTKKIQNIMVNLKNANESAAILKSASVTDFYAVVDADFKKAREITRYVLGEEY